jgi:hypothetical protein
MKLLLVILLFSGCTIARDVIEVKYVPVSFVKADTLKRIVGDVYGDVIKYRYVDSNKLNFWLPNNEGPFTVLHVILRKK